MFTGRLFLSEGALNLKAFLAVAKDTAGTEKKVVSQMIEEKGTISCFR